MKKKRKSPPRRKEKPIPHGAKLLAGMVRLACEMRDKTSSEQYELLGKMLFECVSQGGFGEFVRAMEKHKRITAMTDSERAVWKIFMQLWPESGRRPSNGKVFREIKADPIYGQIAKRSVDVIIDRLRLRKYPRQSCQLAPFIKFVKYLDPK
jgi:hypothetical protein